jgi:hypothetical protein
MRILIFLIGVIMSVSSSATDLASPEKLTLEYIKDFKKWNDYAYKIENENQPNAQWNYEKAYDDIILKYCRETLKYQGLAFGSESRHDPEREKIINSEILNGKAVITTKHKRIVANTDLSNIYEYRFELENNRWYLTSVVVVIDGERYEGL